MAGYERRVDCAPMLRGGFHGWVLVLCLGANALALGGCSVTPSDPGTPSPTCADDQAAIEQKMGAALDAAATDPAIVDTNTVGLPFTVMLRASDGKTYTHSYGDSSDETSYASASTAKLVAAVTLLSLIDEELLSLDSRPRDYIDFWSNEDTMTLRDLLSFTSGFYAKTPCVELPSSSDLSFTECVEEIYTKNLATGSQPSPGSVFYYSPNHLQIAGLMAIGAARNQSWAKGDWKSIFSHFKQQTGLFGNSSFNFPSEDNPLLAGGMTWTASDYLAFLSALYDNKRPSDGAPLLSQASWTALFGNQRGAATVGNSPLWLKLGEDWAYGLGNWLECRAATTSESFSDHCDGNRHRNSSPGAYGAYPFVDFDFGYVGIVARQAPTVGYFPDGVNVFRQIEGDAQTWAAMHCP